MLTLGQQKDMVIEIIVIKINAYKIKWIDEFNVFYIYLIIPVWVCL